MNNEIKSRHSAFLRVVTIFTIAMMVTGLVAFVSQYRSSDEKVERDARERAGKIAEEVKEAVMEYPAHDWLIEYWYEHAGDMDVEYDVDFGKGTRTEKKCRKLAADQPALQLRYATAEELEKLPPKDQKLYAEITYSWLITHLDQIKKTYQMEFLYGCFEQAPYDRQFFLFSAGEKGVPRGTDFGQVYTMGVDVEVAEVQQKAMKMAAETGTYFAMERSYVDYYSRLTKVGDHVLLIGLTYDLSALMEQVMGETFGGTVSAMMYQLLLAILCLAATWFYVLQPLLARNRRITAEKERIATELRLAKGIQAAMLPHIFPPFPVREEIDLFASMDPAREVGGDFYDFFLIDEDHLALLIADVSGKGVPAALFMMESKIILENNSRPGMSPSEILSLSNKAICSNNPMEMFVSVWLGVLELSTGKLQAANAGHEYPVLKRPGEVFELVHDKHGLVVGAMDGIRYKDYELMLEPGTKLFVYTDGLAEATIGDGEMFGTDRMLEVLNQNPQETPEMVIAAMKSAVDQYVGEEEQFDDLTMLCLEYRGKSNA